MKNLSMTMGMSDNLNDNMCHFLDHIDDTWGGDSFDNIAWLRLLLESYNFC